MRLLQQDRPTVGKAKRSQKSKAQESAITVEPTPVPQPKTASLKDFGMLIAVVGAGGLFILLKIRNDRKTEQRNKEMAFARLQQQAENPLEGCFTCTACGWFGRTTPRTLYAPAPSGCGLATGIIIGGFLVLIGLPLLLLGGFGIFPILLGGIIIIASLSTSASNSSQRNVAISIASVTPNNCPQCKNHSVIPANSPNAHNLIATTPHLLAAATEEINRVRALTQSQIIQDTPQAISENRQK